MSVREIIESIAFGRAKRDAKPALGLYLSPDAIFLAEASRVDSQLGAARLARIPLSNNLRNASAAATLNSEFLSDTKKIADLIKPSLGQGPWSSQEVRVSLSHHLSQVRYFPIPSVDRRFLKSAVLIEAKRYIPIAFEQLERDFQVLPAPPDAAGKQRMGVLIAVSQRQCIEHVKKLIEALGLKSAGVEVGPTSFMRLLGGVDPAAERGEYAHIHVDSGSVRIVVCSNGVPVFFREVLLGQDANVGDLRKIDLGGCLSFVEKQFGLPQAKSVRLSGGMANLDILKDALAQESGLPTTVQDLAKTLSIKSGEWGALAALGASAHALVPSPITIDLAPVDRVSDEEMRVARDILLASVACAAMLAGSGLTKAVSMQIQTRELTKYRNSIDPEIAANLKGHTAEEIQVMMKDMQEQLGAIHTLDLDVPKLSQVLKSIIDVMPTNVWLDKISMSSAVPGVGAVRKTLQFELSGHAQDENISAEQAQAFRFKEALLHDPFLSKIFDFQISVNKDEIAPDSTDSKTIAARREGRTTFILDAKAKK